MNIPAWVSDELDVLFDRQIRCRWSDLKHRFVIERKRDRGRMDEILPPKPDFTKFEEPKRSSLEKRFLERLIQVRGGYYTIMELTPGSYTKCPGCEKDIKLTPNEWKAFHCKTCKLDRSVFFIPSWHEVIQQLLRTDPDRGAHGELKEELTTPLAELQREAKFAKERRHVSEAAWKDAWNRVVGIQQVGYTGKEFR